MCIANMEKELVSSHFQFLRNCSKVFASLEDYLVMNVYKNSKAVMGHTGSPELGCQFQNSKNIWKISMNTPVTGDGGLCFFL